MTTTISACALVAGPTGLPEERDATPAIGHIHGLGVSSKTGSLYIAAHGGVFELPPEHSPDAENVGKLTGPIADRAQDTMGFAMVDGQMLASGHPDPRELGTTPPNLGFITSNDNAETWNNVSLIGEVDFHDIAAAVNSTAEWTVYGYSASDGTVMVSRNNGTTWSSGAVLAARDLTVDPSDTETVYATTEDGLAVSRDGGVTFVTVDGSPPLYLVATVAGDDPGLVGIDLEGSVWLQSRGEWRETGNTVGSVEAMTYVDVPSPTLVVADDRGISVSSDFGASWRTVMPK